MKKPQSKKRASLKTDVPQGAKFKAWCESRGLTIAVIAKALEVSDRTVSRMYAGTSRVRSAQFKTLEGI